MDTEILICFALDELALLNQTLDLLHAQELRYVLSMSILDKCNV